jgi:hypothetical protein
VEQSTIEKINQITLMPGVRSVHILPEGNQVWITVNGHQNTHNVFAVLNEIFIPKSYSDKQCTRGSDDSLRANIYPEGLIISITGHPTKEKLSTCDMESKEKLALANITTEHNWKPEEIARQEG